MSCDPDTRHINNCTVNQRIIQRGTVINFSTVFPHYQTA
ncbi:hypothetical protein AD39_1652 [Escherichia coli 1-182-04_S4_C3]|nr:hypothetical protein AD39_1652 [Escherichia coli 1-182-04_S4_C3]